MASLKRLSSVTHSIAHHSVSALSGLHPHLRMTAKSYSQNIVLINLLDKNFSPIYFEENLYLRNAIVTLQQRFFQILNSEGLLEHELKTAILLFDFSYYPTSGNYSSDCYALMEHHSGKKYTHGVNYIGKSLILPERIEAMLKL